MSERPSAAEREGDGYDLIRSALMETGRGRSFLEEHARRSRETDTQALLRAIARLEVVSGHERPPVVAGGARHEFADMLAAIARTRLMIAATRPDDSGLETRVNARDPLEDVLASSEAAMSDIADAAEEIQEATWRLREGGTKGVCDALDQQAARIYGACSAHESVAQGVGLIVGTLRTLEEQIASLAGPSVGAAELDPSDPTATRSGIDATPPRHGGSAFDQEKPAEARDKPASADREPVVELSEVMASETFLNHSSIPVDEPARVEVEVEGHEGDRNGSGRADFVSAFDDLDRLSLQEKLALFS